MSETRGTGMRVPDTFKKDVLVQVWMDARTLTALTQWMKNRHERPRFMSEVVRTPLEWLVDRLIESQEIGDIKDSKYAREYLEDYFRVNLNRGGRGGKNALNNVIVSEDKLSKERERQAEIAREVIEAMGEEEEDIQPGAAILAKMKAAVEERKASEGTDHLPQSNIPLSEDNLDCEPLVDNKPLVKEKMTKDEFATAGDEILRRDKEMEERLKFARPKNVVPD